MKSKVVLILTITVVLLSSLFVGCGISQEEYNKVNAELIALQTQISELQSENRELLVLHRHPLLKEWYEEVLAPFRRTIIKVDDITINMDYFLVRTRLADADAMDMLLVLTNELLIKIEAPRYVAKVSSEDIDQELRRIASGKGETISEIEFKEWYRQLLNENDLSDSEYKEIVATSLLAARLHDYLAERVDTVAEQATALDDWLSEEIKFHETGWYGLNNGFDAETYAWVSWQLAKE